ncbi:hypothetical protein B7R25_07365 [Subtercola boreus]|uniref:O-antigen polymerase n=1 Tax=Subtercola boreus TaxID=120213 RepID=A0A3E0WCU1_9MICO|nr:hypothetical protein B7R24_07295 [Subtercola boreus]RFA21570.1 hypothetical protein B7R23_07240 [Subtercola boreus]RFA27540.1 hypothetical protein B7R25_07365 [Subtercola boreus]
MRFIAAAALILIGARIALPQGVEVGHVAGLLLMPVWIPVVRHYRWGWALLGTGVFAALMGVWLTVFNADTHSTDSSLMLRNTILLVGALVSIGVVLWARRVLPEANVTLWFGIGLAFAITPDSPLFPSNPWKFGFAVPVAIITLSLAYKSGRRWLQLVVLGALTLTSGLNDSRSAFAILLLAAIVVAFQVVPRGKNRRLAALRMVFGLGGLTVVIYNLGQALILDGYLGASTQARSLEQLRTSGSLILGGRPELSASVALFKDQWWGFGSGTVPSLSDISVAKAGMASINYAPDNGYVERYMFGGHYELHSMLGDFWTHFGIAGLLFLAVVVVVAIWGIAMRIADRTASGVIMFASATTLWGVGFSPFYSAAPLFVLMLGMLAIARPAARPFVKETPPWPVTPAHRP